MLSDILKVLIVDDDYISRTNVKMLIDWDNEGFKICGEAADGKAAIEIIEDKSPDIVITDMSMPVLDGASLIRYIEQNYPCIKTVAISGYDDFDYVRQSMKYGAVDYLLKHKLDSKSLLDVLKAARSAIMEERRIKQNKDEIKKQLVEEREVLRQHFVRQLVLGVLNEEKDIADKINKLDMKLENQNLIVAVAEIDDFKLVQEKLSVNEINRLLSSILNIITDIIKDVDRAAAAYIMNGRFAIILSFGNIRRESYMYDQSIALIERIRVSIKRYLNITVYFCLSGVYHRISETIKIYNDTAEALQKKFFSGKDRNIQISRQGHHHDAFIILDIEDEKNIEAALKTFNFGEVKRCISLIFDRITESGSCKSVQMVCAELINIVNRVALEFGMDIGAIYSDEQIPYGKMSNYETIEEVKQWIINILNKFMNLIRIFNINPDYSVSTKKAMLYIHKNYSKNISLSDAAEYLGLNPSYLSRVFKKDCGVGFIEYLSKVRIEHAKWLIEKGDNRLKDIVSEVGFNSYTYFFKIFRRITKMTPLEYEEKCRINNINI